MAAGALRLLRRPGNGGFGTAHHTELVLWREGGERADVGGQNFLGRPVRVTTLARLKKCPFRRTGGEDGAGRDYPPGWYPSTELRAGDAARFLRVAAKAPGYYSARGRRILGHETIAEGRARKQRQEREAAEGMCHARTGRGWWQVCYQREVVACDVQDRRGRCAEHA